MVIGFVGILSMASHPSPSQAPDAPTKQTDTDTASLSSSETISTAAGVVDYGTIRIELLKAVLDRVVLGREVVSIEHPTTAAPHHYRPLNNTGATTPGLVHSQHFDSHRDTQQHTALDRSRGNPWGDSAPKLLQKEATPAEQKSVSEISHKAELTSDKKQKQPSESRSPVDEKAFPAEKGEAPVIARDSKEALAVSTDRDTQVSSTHDSGPLTPAHSTREAEPVVTAGTNTDTTQDNSNVFATETTPIERHVETHQQNTEQVQDLRVEQRLDHIRLLQQINGSFHDDSAPHAFTYPTQDRTSNDLTLAPQNYSLHQPSQEITTARQSLFDNLTLLENQIIQVSPVTRAVASEQQQHPLNIQGRQELSKNPAPRGQTQSTSADLQHNDRSSSNPIPPRITKAITNSAVEASKYEPCRDVTPRTEQLEQHKVSSILSNSIPEIIASLRRYAGSSGDISLLRSLDSSIENACLTIATGLAIGIIGPALAVRTSARLATKLREQILAPDLEELDLKDPEHEELAKALEDALNEFSPSTIATDLSSTGLVADVAGIVFFADSMRPAHNAKLKSSELGECTTTEDGIFIFQNVPLGVSYTITIEDPRAQGRSHTISGTSSEVSYLRIALT